MKAKRKATEEKVYKSTEMLMSRYGIKGWNMNDLAQASGITKRTLYKIIESKEQLIRHVAFSNIHAMRDKIVDITRCDSGFMERMEKMINTVPEVLKNNYINNYSDILNEFPELEGDIVRENEKLFDEIRSFYQGGIDGGYIRSDIAPELIHHMVQALVIYFSKYPSSEADYTSRMKAALNSLFFGITIRQQS